MGRGKTGNFWKAAAILLGCALLTGCGNTGEVDDYATNIGYEARGSNGTTQVVQSESGSSATTQTAGIPKEEIKVGVLHLSDPAEGSGYTYTHDLGIQGMQQNLGLSDDQIIRKINVNDSDTQETRQAIQECIDEGCNIIFTTSWGYMETTAEMAEEYPDVYFSQGTGCLSIGKNFNNYFGRIYQARYLSGIVAGMNTSSNKIGYVAAMDSSNSEVTGGIDAFALGIYSVNPDAKVYVKVTNSWYDPEKEEAASRQLLDMGCDVMAQHCDTPYPQTLAQKAGVDPDLVFQAIKGGLAGSTVMNAKAPMMIEGHDKPGFKIDLHIKDLNNALDCAHAVGAPVPMPASVQEILQWLHNNDCGGNDHSAIAKNYERLTGI